MGSANLKSLHVNSKLQTISCARLLLFLLKEWNS